MYFNLILPVSVAVLVLTCLITIFIVAKSVPRSKKEEKKQFDENQKTSRWRAAYYTLITLAVFCVVIFFVTLALNKYAFLHPSYFIFCALILSFTQYLCLCFWKDIFYAFSHMSDKRKNTFKVILSLFIALEIPLSAAGIIFAFTEFYVYLIILVVSAIALVTTFKKKMKADKDSLNIDNSDFIR